MGRLFLQLIANLYFIMLKRAKTEEAFMKMYKKAMEFNRICIEMNIYLK